MFNQIITIRPDGATLVSYEIKESMILNNYAIKDETLLSLAKSEGSKQLPTEVLAHLLKFISYKEGMNISLSSKQFFYLHRKEMVEQLLPILKKNHINAEGSLSINYQLKCDVEELMKSKELTSEKLLLRNFNDENKDELLLVKNLGALPKKIDAFIKTLPKEDKQVCKFNRE